MSEGDTHKMRVTIDRDDWERMVEGAPAALRDPEVARHYISLGLRFQKVREDGLKKTTYKDFRQEINEEEDETEPEQ